MHVISRREWAFLALILVFSFIPAVFGLLRIPELLGGPPIIPPNPRAMIDPVPIALHILGSSIFCLAGAVQFLPSLRRHRPALHRVLRAGRGGCGMRQRAHRALDDRDLCVSRGPAGTTALRARVTLSLAMVAFIAWAVVAIRARRIAAHRAAMLRAYAIGQGASTQTALFLIAMALFDFEPLGSSRDILMVGAWVINLAAAELLIRRAFATRTSSAVISGRS
jgi:hypothetical protein